MHMQIMEHCSKWECSHKFACKCAHTSCVNEALDHAAYSWFLYGLLTFAALTRSLNKLLNQYCDLCCQQRISRTRSRRFSLTMGILDPLLPVHFHCRFLVMFENELGFNIFQGSHFCPEFFFSDWKKSFQISRFSKPSGNPHGCFT